jgi:peptidoglycan/LPS O-acetylase OafA/YrhL
LLPVLALSTVVAWAVMTGEDFRHFGRSLGATAMFVSNVWYALRSSYFLPEASVLPLLHTWSLGVEEQFYLVFPLVLAICWRIGRRARMVAIVSLLIASLALASWMAAERPEWAFFLLPTRLWELMAGAACALATGPARTPGWVGWAGLALLAAGFALIDESTKVPGLLLLLPVAGTIAALLSGPRSATARFLSLRPLVAIGAASYGTYLWHLPLFAFAHYLRFGPLPAAVVGALIGASLIAGWLSYRLIEQPVRRSTILGSRKSLALFCVGGLLLFAALGIAIATERLNARGAGLERSLDARFAGEGIDQIELPPGDAAMPFVLYGDSHARQYYRAFSDRFGGGALISGDGCLSLPGLSNIDPPDPDAKECRSKFTELAALVRARPAGVVIFAALWDRPLWGTAGGPIGAMPSRGGRLAFEQALARAIEQVPPSTRLVIIGHVPAARPKGAPAMQFGWLRCRTYLNANCPTLIARRQAEGSAVNRVLREFAANHPRVVFVDPEDLLCGQATCPIITKGRLVYSDESHVALWAGRRIVDRVAQLLTAPAPAATRLP